MSVFSKTMAVAAVLGMGAFASYGQDQSKDTAMHMDMNMPDGHMSMKAHHHGHDSAMTSTEVQTQNKAKPAAKSKLVPQKTCPVQGDPIDRSIYVDYKGKRVYFCCAMCPDIFKKDPEKYLKILADRGEAVGDVPKK